MKINKNTKNFEIGGVLLEAMLSISVLIIIIFGTLDFSNYFFEQQELYNAMGETMSKIQGYAEVPSNEGAINGYHIIVHTILESYLTRKEKDPLDYTTKSGAYISYLEETDQHIGFIWVGAKSKTESKIFNFSLNVFPCATALIPLALDYSEVLTQVDPPTETTLQTKQESLDYTPTPCNSGDSNCTCIDVNECYITYVWDFLQEPFIQNELNEFCKS